MGGCVCAKKSATIQDIDLLDPVKEEDDEEDKEGDKIDVKLNDYMSKVYTILKYRQK